MNIRLYALRHALFEGNECYDMMVAAVGAPNIDRAGYTSQIKLDAFREILGRPDLTIEELSSLLRAARNQVWADFKDFDQKHITFEEPLPPNDPVSHNHRQLAPHQRPHARIPKPTVANVANDPGRDWATLMARVVMSRANEEESHNIRFYED